mgnify:CR=1 FL=1
MNWQKVKMDGWHKFICGDFILEPEDLDFGIWELWHQAQKIKVASLAECKSHAEWMNKQMQT